MRQFFTEDNNRFSMKRLCGFLCTISLCAKLIHTPTEALVYTVGALAGAALAALNDKGRTVIFAVDSDHRPLGILHIHDLLKAGIV
jgi:CBS domain containing-hemolysin-like protein